MSDEDSILEEAMDNLMEAAQRIRATQNRLRSAGLGSALALTEAAYFEARRRSERGSGHHT